jgi:phosphoglycolate phosphatase
VDLRLIVFDVDGTLVDSQAHILASMDGAFAAVGRAVPTRAEVLSIVGLSLPVAVRTLVPDAGQDEADRMVEAYKTTFQTIRMAGDAPSPLFPGTRAMLDRMQARDGTLLGVATGKSRRGLDYLIAAHGLGDLFLTRQVADDHPSKPHPSMLRQALAETGVNAGNAVMVGDTEYDVEMGRAAGMPVIAVDWGYHGRARLGGADRIISSWAAFDAALEEIWR